MQLQILTKRIYFAGQNANPKFVSATYSKNVPEDAANETLIIQVNATDADTPGTPDGTFGYSIKSGNQGRRFVVDATTGSIYLAQKLDYETQDSYLLTLVVTDGGGLSDTATVTVTVENVNDNPPVCTPSVAFGNIFENQPAYTQFAQFSCSDPDNLPGQNITYQPYQGTGTISRSDTIRVGVNNGSVYTLRPIDYDVEGDVFLLTVVVSDNGSPPLSVKCSVVLSLKDLDDNPPMFSSLTYNGRVNDNAALGDIVLSVTATDADQPQTPRSLRYFQSSCVPDYLMVDLHSGDVIVNSTIDGLKYQNITCNVTASSVSSTTSTATVNVVIDKVINNPPTFQQPFYQTSVTENYKVGDIVIQVSALDPDQTKVTYNISNGIFSIDSSGRVTAKTSPDYETQTAHLVILTAIDAGTPPSTAQAFLQVIINPVNEFKPTFTSICKGSIAENATSGTSIIRVSAYDNDTGLDGAVSYSIQSSNVPVCMNKNSGVIEVAGVLDYDTQSVITFVIAATDSSTGTPKSSQQTCTITVTDVNEQSVQCSQPNVRRMHYPFLTGYPANFVNCNPNTGSLIYSILNGNTDSAFKMYPNDSAIYLDKDPTQQQYSLTIGVSNGGMDTINVTAIFFIELQLKFTNLPSTIDMTEGVAAGLIFTVTACCVFPKIEFTMLSGNEDNRITFTSSNGQVRLMVPYDRETQDVYIYKILATSDSGQTATSNLTVNVGDVNDNAPKFAQDLYERNVDEKLSVSSFIDQFTASDPDFGNNSTLTYTIVSGNTGSAFGIDNTGSLTLATALSYATTSRYVLVIRATDSGSPQRTGDTTVIINVQDNNNNPPQFIPMPGVYRTIVSEGTAIGRFVFQLQASNGNSTNITGHFTYAILSGNSRNDFQVASSNGTLFLTRYLDREIIPSYNLTVSATNENGFSVNGTLIIDIEDINDNCPVFSPDVLVFPLLDATASGTTVGTIRVTDADAGANGTVTLTLGSGNTGNAFRLNGNVLITSTIMNYLAVNYYRIQVIGTDGGSPSCSSTSTFVVLVQHGYIPFFNITSLTLTVPENEMIGSQIIDLNATGLGCPEDGSMDYELFSGGGGNKFEVRRKTGIVVLVHELDFEKTKVYTLVIIATNKDPNNPKTATCSLTVSITDYNDNQPVFDREGYSFDVKEYSQSGVSVGVVLATDADSGINQQVYETLTGCSDFAINPSSGLITVAGVLDYLVKPYYSCFVLATDGGRPQKSAIASVVIRLIDTNNHIPYSVGATSVRFYDSMPAGSDVFKLSTIDLDTGDAGNVSCVIDGPPNLSAFIMDPTTCILQTTQTLDATVQSVYTMTIREYDAGQPSLENKTTITINLMPSYPNNYDPTYPANCATSVTINRGASVGSYVAGCIPTDLDNGPSGEVESWIVSGNDDGYFIIDVHTAYINTATSLLLAQNIYTLIICSTDKGSPPRNATITITISITPQVTTNITADYNFTIAEDATGLVGVIKVDPGRTVTGCTIQEGNFDNAFGIQLQSNGDGNIVSINIDRERYQIYSLLVVVTTDIGVLTKVVQIIVLDINDNKPIFDAPSTGIQLNVAEYTPAGTTVATVSYTDKDTDAVNRNNTLSVAPPGSTYFTIDQAGNLMTTTTALNYKTVQSLSFNIEASDTKYTSTLAVTINVIDVPEKENVSKSDVTNNAVISLEAPYQASIGDLVYTLKPGDFSLTLSPTDFVQYVFFQTSTPFSINSDTGDIRVSAQLINHNRYLLWVMIRVINSTTTITRTSLLRIDTFDMLTQMIVMQFTSTLTYVQSIQRRIQLRTQAYFSDTQRVGIFKLVGSGNTFRRRLLAQQSAAYAYVVRSTSSDNMTNINDPKDFLTQQEILSILQQSSDGTPTPGLSDPSTADVSSVSPYEDGSSRNEFEEFINTPAGIAVFCLLGLFLLVILIIIATCIFYRKCYRKNRKPVKTKVKDKKSKFSRIRDPDQPTNSNSVPGVFVSAPSPVTHMNPPNDNRLTPPPRVDSFDPIKIYSDFSSQTEPPNDGKSIKKKKNKTVGDKN